jgi:hypothetical protein
MAELTPSQLDGFAREVAGAVSQGFSFDQIRNQFDLAIHELDQIFDSEEFTEYLTSYGTSVVEAWKETRAGERAGSFHRKVSERFDTYYDELHGLAMNKGLKPEKRADILLTLMKYVAPPDEKAAQAVRLPPDLIENWVRRVIEYDEAAASQGRRVRDSSGERTSKANSNNGEEQSLLLRHDRDANGGSDSRTASTFRQLYTDDPMEWGPGE